MKKIIPFIMIILLFFGFFNNVGGEGQDVCPEGNGWIKTEDLAGCEFIFEIPDGCLVTSYCYKAGTYCSGPQPVEPPAEGVFHLVLDEEECQHDLSHVSVLVVCPTATPYPTPTVTPMDPTPTATPMDPTPTATPVDPTPTATPMDPTPTATPVDPTPTATPVDPTPTVIPEDPIPTPDVIIPPTGGDGNSLIFYGLLWGTLLLLVGLGLFLFFRLRSKKA